MNIYFGTIILLCLLNKIFVFIRMDTEQGLYLSKLVNDNQTFQDINTWFKVNLFTLNLNKTHYLEFRTKNCYNVNTQIEYDQECIISASEIKFLGLTIDDTLSWKQHIEQVLNKMCTACYALRNIKHIVPIDTRRVIYFAHIQSIISYGIIFCCS